MPVLLPPLRLTGATVLRDGALQNRSLAFAAGRLTRGPLPEVDLSGFLILPGIVDCHATLPGPDCDPIALHLDAAAAGVTSSVPVLGWGWPAGPRGADRAEAALRRLAGLRARLATDIRPHLRAEVTAVADEARLLAAVRARQVHGVIFADTGVEGQTLPDPALQDPALDEARRQAQRARRDVPRHLCRLAEAFDALSLPYGSLADPDGETRERHSMIGARIAVFPATRRAAVAAHAMMSPVVLSAPAIAMGDRVAGGLIAEGIGDALASDGQPGAIIPAVMRLVARIGWVRAWRLVSSGPAEILRLTDRGALDAGMRADLVIIDPLTGQVGATICAGRLTHVTGEVAERFRAQAFAEPLLASADRPPMAAE